MKCLKEKTLSKKTINLKTIKTKTSNNSEMPKKEIGIKAKRTNQRIKMALKELKRLLKKRMEKK